jgi:two-component system, LuxR family, sensor kinase FixL
LTNSLQNLDFLVLFEAVAEAMVLTNDAGYVIAANTSAQQMLAYSADEIIGLSVEKLMPTALRQHHEQLRSRFFKKPEKRSMGNGKNLVALTQDGRELPVDIGLSPIALNGQHYVLVTFHTAEKQLATEASLKASEERLRLAKASAGLGVFDIDFEQKTVRYDALIQQIFGFQSIECIDYDQFVNAIDDADQSNWLNMFHHAANTEQDSEYKIEFRVNHISTQSQRWLHAAGKVFFHDHVAKRMLGVVQDMTEHKLLQKKLNEQRIDLEVLSKTQTAIQTASAIAHEINQPLAAISAYSEVALYALKADKIDGERLNRSLLGCVEQAQRAGNTLHELMEFLQKGKVESSPINLNEIVNEALSITQHSGYGGFQSSLDLEPDLPKVLANETQLRKVLVNLLTNGVEAVHQTGIPVAKIKVKVRTHGDVNLAEVIIQDNGPGLSPEVSKRIFEPFFTTKPHGIGMGLAISRSLIESCGGQLWFDASSSSGATFHLTLPFSIN